MKGLYKYLVGGVVGAVFGFLVAPKRAQKVRDALLGRETAPALPEQLLRSLPPAVFSPSTAGVEYAPPVMEAEPAVEMPHVTEIAAEEPQSLESPEAVGQDVEIPGPAETEPVDSLESAPVEIREDVEEELSAPWETAAHEESEALPLTYPSEPPELEPEPEPASQPMPWPEQDQAGTPLPEEIRELAASFVPGAPAPETVLELETVAVEESEVEVQPVVEAPAAQEPEPVVEPEPAADSADIVEPEVSAEPAVAVVPEAPSTVPAEETVPQAAEGMDLRARIEETRRRIREEIERPFRVAELAEEEPAPGLASLPPVQEAPSVPEPPSAAVAEPVSPEPSLAPPPVVEPTVEQGEFDYEAMRRRIEETRSRLKAKAFDAMMSGETSLLAQGQESGAGQTGAAPVSLDEDVDQSIEAGLSAEDA